MSSQPNTKPSDNNPAPSQHLKRPREDDPPSEPPRPRKRPGGASRINRESASAVQQRQQQREAEAAAAAHASRGNEEVVRQHYNAVPERGREWRKTDSRIKGLRSFNNWIKSTIIHKFSPNEREGEHDPLVVLDIGCGKGGDLFKWAQAPQTVGQYVGIDPAEVSIEQARERYRQMRHGGGGGRGGRGGHHGGRNKRVFEAAFLVDDAFANSLGDLPIIRQIGFGPGSRWGPSGGFDVVTMMFCMHYAFESEAKAQGMLSNVANSLRKGGRFIGVIPNSDVLGDAVVEFHKRKAERAKEKGPVAAAEVAKEKEDNVTNGTAPSDEKRSEERQEATRALNNLTEPAPDAPSVSNGGVASATSHLTPPDAEKSESSAFAEWGNSIYRVRFPGQTPTDGIFRPPFGWKYSYFMEEAVEEVPEYVVPWEAFRAIAEDYNLELQYRRPFREIWEEEGNSPTFGPLSERMGVRGRDGGGLLVSDEEMEAASEFAYTLLRLG